MSKQLLRCRCGHCWEVTLDGPIPGDVSTLCPMCCAVAGQNTLDDSAPSGLPTAPAADRLEPGYVLAGFQVIEEVNRGGMGVIYKARQLGLDRIVALKVIAPERLRSKEAMGRFQREVRAAALLSHPNIVTVYHTDLDGPLPYLAMEYVAGIDLARLVKTAGALEVRDACLYAREAAQGLQHAFEQGLVHRDIKPANLMVTPSPLAKVAAPVGGARIKILDMGLARVTEVEEMDEAAASLTRAGEFLGTPDYIAPEQAEDARHADIRSDLYSLGGTMYFLLTGEVPFPGATLMQKLRRQISDPRPTPSARRPGIPTTVDALVKRLLALDPGERFQTPVELIAALDTMLRGMGTGPVLTRSALATRAAPAAPEQDRCVEAHTGGVQGLGTSADGRIVVSAGVDETVRVWDAEALRELRCLAGDLGPVERVAVAPGGKWAATTATRLFKSDMAVQLWDLASGRELRRLRAHDGQVSCVAISADSRRIASGGKDETVRLWTLDRPASVPWCLRGHKGAVTSLVFLPNGSAILSGGEDGVVRLWDVASGASKGSITAQVGKVEALAFSGQGNRLAIGGSGLRLRQGGSPFMSLTGHRGVVLCLAFSADGQRLLSGDDDGVIRLWRSDDGKMLRTLAGHRGRVRGVAFSRDGRFAYSGGADGTIRRWRLPSA